MTTNRVKNIIKNYKSYVSEYKLMMRRVDNNNKVLDEESYRYVQFIHISRYDHLIDTQIKSLDEIENIFYGANPSNLIERIIEDYNEIDTWLKLVKAKNPILKKYEMNGSTHLYFSKNLDHEHSKIVLSYIAMLDSFEVFYKPILEVIPNKTLSKIETKNVSEENQNEDQHLKDLFNDENLYKKVIDILIDKNHIEKGTMIWKDETNGRNKFVAGLIKVLFYKGYLSRGAKNREIPIISKNTFNVKLSQSIAEKTKVNENEQNYKFIPISSDLK